MSTATLWITNNGRMAHMIGANHAGLALYHEGYGPTYITWDGGGRNQRSVGCGVNFKGQVDWRLGHRRADGSAAPAITAARDGFSGGLQNPRYHNFPAYACDIPVSDLAARDFDFNSSQRLWGLSIDPIVEWWGNIMAMPPDDPKRIYSKLGTWEDFDRGKGTNCCGMVALALGIGGLSGFAPPPDNMIYQDSRTLIDWVGKAVKKINTLNRERNVILSQPGYTQAEPWDTLPSLEVWKAESKVTFGARKDQIAEIDAILAGGTRPSNAPYSTLVSVLSSEVSPELKKCADLYQLCFNHLVSKPTSDRRRAVLRLAKTVEKVGNEIIHIRSSGSFSSLSGSFSSIDLD